MYIISIDMCQVLYYNPSKFVIMGGVYESRHHGNIRLEIETNFVWPNGIDACGRASSISSAGSFCLDG